MTNAETQYPSLIFFIGSRFKETALRELFPNNNIRRAHRNGMVNLRLDSSTISSDLPLLFADADPRRFIPHELGPTPCHEHETTPLEWQLRQSDLARTLYARLVAPFADVVCIFADDFNGLGNVASFLVHWVRMGSASTLPIAVRPRVLIVAREATAATHDVLEMEDLRYRLDKESLFARDEVFSSVSIIHLAGDHVSPRAQHRRLREVLMMELEEARNVRIRQKCHFSALHFEAFFRRSIEHIAHSITEPFDFIASTRQANEVTNNYAEHFKSFVSLGTEYFVAYQSLVSFIASAIMMDAYPPRMHKFDPRLVFRRLYKAHCLTALSSVLNSSKFAEDLCICIEDNMVSHFPALDQGFETAAQLHANNLRSSSSQWSQLQSHRTCIFCICRKPEHVLTCEHAICDKCVLIFGSPVIGKEHWFEVHSCPFCLTKGRLMATLKPKTAGVRILSIDGGGVRGVVPLEFLGLLQKLLGSNLDLQDFFEQAFGTSSGKDKSLPLTAISDNNSGGLIILGLFLKHWNVTRCARVFDHLIKDFFSTNISKASGLLTRLRHWLRCWLSDGCYDVTALESSLKKIFGDDRKVFDIDRYGVSGQKIAVTATTLSDASTYIFSNYNGMGTRDRGCGYKHVRPDRVEDEPFLWEAGRVTSAAPGLFKPARIASLGSFQDGGLKHNNPVDLAIWECAKIWAPDTALDVVLSLGTGTEDSLRSPKAPHFRDVLNDGFIPRLCRSFMSSLDGERVWKELGNRLDEDSKADFFRLNVPFQGDEPRLDDVGCVDELRRSVHLHAEGPRDRTKIALALLVASFFFELDTVPWFEGGRYLCQGYIRCRNDPKAVIHALIRLYGAQMEFTFETGTLGALSVEDVCSTCNLYCKKVRFYVRHLKENVKMHLRVNGLERRKLSGFPHSMAWFVHQQQLDSPFGNAEHGAPGSFRCGACRVIHTYPGPLGRKRKRGAEEDLSSPQTFKKRAKIALSVRRPGR